MASCVTGLVIQKRILTGSTQEVTLYGPFGPQVTLAYLG